MKLRDDQTPETPPDEEPSQYQSDDVTSSQVMLRSGSHTTDDERPPSRAKRTARIGGDDSDSERPAKLARISEDIDNLSASQASDDDVEMNDDGGVFTASFPQELESSKEKIDEVLSSQVATPELEASPSASARFDGLEKQAPRTSGRGRGKRPKGWHLRRENRHLRESAVKGSPVRSERQESVDTIENTQYEPAGLLKRLPGRRRAPHSDPSIEADMRRQLELKIAYRAVAKSLKPLLAELAQRTADSLEKEPELHRQYLEHDNILDELDERLRLRLGILEAEYQLESHRLEFLRDAETDILSRRFESHVDDCIDDSLLKCEHRLLCLLRKSEQERDDEATDDEGGDVLPQQFRTDPTTGDRALLDTKYDSRSAFFVSTERLWSQTTYREKLRLLQTKQEPMSLVVAPKDFALVDKKQRESARAELWLIGLIEAGRRAEEEAVIQAKRAAQEAEKRLQILASVSESAVPSYATAVLKAEDSPRPILASQNTVHAKGRGNALAISNLVSDDAAAPLSKVEPLEESRRERVDHFLPPGSQQGLQNAPQSVPPPAPGYYGPQKPIDQPAAERERPVRPVSEYPPHPMGREYAERRADYAPAQQSTGFGFSREPVEQHLHQPHYTYPSSEAGSRFYGQPSYEQPIVRPHHYPPPTYYDSRYAGEGGPAPPPGRSDGVHREGRPYEGMYQPHHAPSPTFYQHPPPHYASGPPPPGSYPHSQHHGPGIPMPQASPPERRSDVGHRQHYQAGPPRTMYDPARPESHAMASTPLPPSERSHLQRGQQLEFRPWSGTGEKPQEVSHGHHPYIDPGHRAVPYMSVIDTRRDPRELAYGPPYPVVPGAPPPQQMTDEPPQSQRNRPQKRAPKRSDKQRGSHDSPNDAFRVYQGPGAEVQFAPAAHVQPPYAMTPLLSQPVHGAPRPEQPSNMQGHPGQRMGHQLLPASMDPARPPTSQPQSSQSSPAGRAPHHRHSSSTTSARAGFEIEASHSGYPERGEHRQVSQAGNGPGQVPESATSPSFGAGPTSTPSQGHGPPPGWQQSQQQPLVWPGFESQYPPHYATSGRRFSQPAPSQRGHHSSGSGHHSRQPQPVIRSWQPEPPGGRPATFIYTNQNGEAPKSIDGRIMRNRTKGSPSPPAQPRGR